ncbi:MAG: hypothetical protein IKL31_06380 [Ruminococcus sp.]|nr:hypothetical protein [Ruminococcus sp.]
MLTEVLKEITYLRITLQAYLSVTTESNTINPYESFNTHLSAIKAHQKDGKVYEAIINISISSGMKWLKNISACKPLTDLLF